MVKTSTEGQALELGSRRDRVLDLALMDYIALAGKKTRWYTTVAPCGWRHHRLSRNCGASAVSASCWVWPSTAFHTRDDLLLREMVEFVLLRQS